MEKIKDYNQMYDELFSIIEKLDNRRQELIRCSVPYIDTSYLIILNNKFLKAEDLLKDAADEVQKVIELRKQK